MNNKFIALCALSIGLALGVGGVVAAAEKAAGEKGVATAAKVRELGAMVENSVKQLKTIDETECKKYVDALFGALDDTSINVADCVNSALDGLKIEYNDFKSVTNEQQTTYLSNLNSLIDAVFSKIIDFEFIFSTDSNNKVKIIFASCCSNFVDMNKANRLCSMNSELSRYGCTASEDTCDALLLRCAEMIKFALANQLSECKRNLYAYPESYRSMIEFISSMAINSDDSAINILKDICSDASFNGSCLAESLVSKEKLLEKIDRSDLYQEPIVSISTKSSGWRLMSSGHGRSSDSPHVAEGPSPDKSSAALSAAKYGAAGAVGAFGIGAISLGVHIWTLSMTRDRLRKQGNDTSALDSKISGLRKKLKWLIPTFAAAGALVGAGAAVIGKRFSSTQE